MKLAAVEEPHPPKASPTERILGRLSRRTSSGRFIPELDGLRFVAILLVVLFHGHRHFFPSEFSQQPSVWQVFSYIANRGFVGVQLFFAISGFILALPFALHHLDKGSAIKLRSFYLRRLTRLEPPYVINLVFLFVVSATVAPNTWAFLTDQLPHLLASAVYVHHFVYGEWSTINHVAWSLEVEVQFYLLAPFLCQIFRIRHTPLRRTLLTGLIGGGILFCHWSNDAVWGRNLFGQLQFFLVGLLLVDFYVVSWRQQSQNCWIWDLLGLAAWALIPGWPGIHPYMPFLLPWLILIAYAAALNGCLLRHALRNRWVATLGGMCYTVYLYHISVIDATVYWLPIDPQNLLSTVFFLCLTLIAVFAVGGVLFALIERPCMNRHWPMIVAERVRRIYRTLKRRIPVAGK